MMHSPTVSSLLLLTLGLHVTRAESPAIIHLNIGAVLSSAKHIDFFRTVVEDLNGERNRLPKGVKLNATAIVMDDNPIRAAQLICEKIIPHRIYVVVASHSTYTGGTTSPLAVSYTCGYYKIPVIGISARDSIFSDKVSFKCNQYLYNVF